MIADCEAGKIDRIITKSISRFARNTLDCLTVARKLKQQDPPVAIFFENEGITTTDKNTDAMLALLSSVAQGDILKISPNLSSGLVEIGSPVAFLFVSDLVHIGL